MSTAGQGEEIVVRFRAGGERSEELQDLWNWLESETPGGLHAELRSAPGAEAKSGVFIAIAYIVAGGFAGGVAEGLTSSLIEALKSWRRARLDMGRTPGALVVEQGGTQIADVPADDDPEDEQTGEE